MKKFLIHIGILIAITLVSMVLLDGLYTYSQRNGHVRFKPQKLFQEKNKTYDYVFLGSSRTENHIDCALIEQLTGKSCINLGMSGGHVRDSFVFMKLAEQNNIKFNKVFLQVDYGYNVENLSVNFKARVMPILSSAALKDEKMFKAEEQWKSYVPFAKYMNFDKVIGFREFFNISIANNSNINLDNGFTALTDQTTDLRGELPESLNKGNTAIDQMIQLSAESNIELFFYTAPFCSKTKGRSIFDGFDERLPNFKNYVKFFDDQEQYFDDCGHLNVNGARVFTAQLSKDYNL